MIGLNRIIVGDAYEQLRQLPNGFVDCVITSPPYFRLRDYRHAGQIGLELHVDQWAKALRKVARELHRVLVPTGSLWLNLGDRYSTGTEGASPKGLLLGPERLALALIGDGWILRNKIVWAKRNPLPNPTRDRLSCTWEVVYLLVKQRSYFFDLDAIRVPHTSTRPPAKGSRSSWSVPPAWRVSASAHSGLDLLNAEGRVGHLLGKNPGDVWSLSTAAYRGAHHAVFPLSLIERPVKSGSPERRCRRCRHPWKRATIRKLGHMAVRGELQPSCGCHAAWEPGVVLDPFIGSGTKAIAAEQHRRNWLAIELNPAFAQVASERIAAARSARRVDEGSQRARSAAA
ncbi:MAG: site-specific DNA-methyltransferase [Gaiellaceae bacterium]